MAQEVGVSASLTLYQTVSQILVLVTRNVSALVIQMLAVLVLERALVLMFKLRAGRQAAPKPVQQAIALISPEVLRLSLLELVLEERRALVLYMLSKRQP